MLCKICKVFNCSTHSFTYERAAVADTPHSRSNYDSEFKCGHGECRYNCYRAKCQTTDVTLNKSAIDLISMLSTSYDSNPCAITEFLKNIESSIQCIDVYLALQSLSFGCIDHKDKPNVKHSTAKKRTFIPKIALKSIKNNIES